MTRYGDPGHEQWLIEQEQEDERWAPFAHQEVMAEIGRRETEGLDDGIGAPDDDVDTRSSEDFEDLEGEEREWGDDLPSQREAEALAEARADQEIEAQRDRRDEQERCPHCLQRPRLPGLTHCGHRWCHEADDWGRQSAAEVARWGVADHYLARLRRAASGGPFDA
jgi:hypothetical protein